MGTITGIAVLSMSLLFLQNLPQSSGTTCSYTCYTSQRYTTSCGFLGWSRCGRYRSVATTCYRCCSGWTGSGCNTAICNPSCPNGGSCTRPNYCSNCNDEYYSPSCAKCPVNRISMCARIHCTEGPTNFRCQECQHQFGSDSSTDISRSAYVPSSSKTACVATCSWLNHACWPGTCSDHYPGTCSCMAGFSETSSHTCELSSNNVPTLSACHTVMTDSAGTVKSTILGSPNTCPNEGDVFVNTQPNTLNTTFVSSFKVENLPSTPSHIQDWSFGVVEKKVVYKKVSSAGSTTTLETKSLSGSNLCTPNSFSSTDPKLSPHCQVVKSWNHGRFSDGERLCMEFQSLSGGNYRTKNAINNAIHQRLQYTSRQASETVCFKFDFTKPAHCSLVSSCSSSKQVLDFGQRIRRSGDLSLKFEDWTDSLSVGASGIKEYHIDVFHIIQADISNLQMGSKAMNTIKTSNTQVNLQLPQDQKLYAIVLTVLDTAGNFREARRFVLYDNTSKIEVDSNSPIRVTTAESSTNYVWHTVLSAASVSWQEHFYNSLHHGNNLLRPIKSDIRFPDAYDQTTGELSRSGKTNVHGIVSFQYYVSSDIFAVVNTNNFIRTQGFPNQAIALSSTQLQDGDSYRVWLQATDVMGNTKVDSVVFHVDSSPPEIHDAWLQNNGQTHVFVYGSNMLHEMELFFKALDRHSGLKQVLWKLGTARGSSNIGSGSLPVRQNSTCPPNTACYCPLYQGSTCSYMDFKVDLNKLVQSDTHIGNHNRKYYFNLEVTNNANLITEQNITILVDESPPQVGSVMDGLETQKEIDYTSENIVNAHWTGFSDPESGIESYRYAVSETCLTKAQMLQKENEGIWKNTRESSFQTRYDLNEYFVTVLAFNRAIEPSDVACSDGVIVDRSPPVIFNVSIHNSQNVKSVVCVVGNPWFVRHDGKRQALSLVEECASLCQEDSPGSGAFLPMLNNVTIADDESKDICSLYGTNDYSVHLHQDSLEVSWSYLEPQSQVNEILVGVSSTKNNDVLPDLLAFQSSQTRNYFKEIHTTFGSASKFYVLIKAINKAQLSSTITIGPVFIDETPPKSDMTLTPSVENGIVSLVWGENVFYDDDQEGPVTDFEYAVGTAAYPEDVSHFRAVEQRNTCGENAFCVKHPLIEIQDHSMESSIKNHEDYIISIKAFNSAGLFSVHQSTAIFAPSLFPPSVGLLYDINPDIIETSAKYSDVDFQFNTSTVCVSWKSFEHHTNNVSYEVGLGLQQGLADVVSISAAESNNRHCFTGLSLQHNQRYFTTLHAISHGTKTVLSTDGVTVVDQSKINLDMTVFDGEVCDHTHTISRLQNQSISVNTQEQIVYNISISKLFPHLFTLYVKLKVQSQGQIAFTVGDASEIHSITPLTEHLLIKFQASSSTEDVTVKNLGPQAITVEDISVLKCINQMDYQSSTNSLSTHWEVSSDITWTHYQVHLIEEDCRSAAGSRDCINEGMFGQKIVVKDQNHYMFTNLNLKPGFRYRSMVAVCFHDQCLAPVSSNGTLILPKAPFPSVLKAEGKVVEEQNPLQIKITLEWEPFLNKDIEQNVKWYEWNLFSGPSNTQALFAWNSVTVDDDTQHIKVESQVNIKPFYLSTLTAVVRGYSPANVISAASQRLTLDIDLSTAGPLVYDISTKDAVPEKLMLFASKKLGSLEDTLHSMEIDYTKHVLDISAVITETQYNRYFWWLIEDLSLSYSDCVDKHPRCISYLETDDYYATFKGLRLQHGQRYHSCVMANSTSLNGEGDAVVQLPDIRVCSNGFLVDLTPPEPGHVRMFSSQSRYQADNSILIFTWEGFSDVETFRDPAHVSGIQTYHISVGTLPGKQDTIQWTNVGFTNHFKADNLTLESGRTYYATVKAIDFVGLSVTATSNGVTIDTSPPDAGFVYVGSVENHIPVVPCSSFEVHWGGFSDPQSPVTIELAIGSHEHSHDVYPFTRQLTDTALISGLQLIEGHTYFALIKARNLANLVTDMSSLPFSCDKTPPEKGFILDGSGNTDVDYQTDTEHLSAHWDGFRDMAGGLRYRFCVGTSPSHDDVRSYEDVGEHQAFDLQLPLISGETYYTTVEACNKVDLCISVSSDGVTIDNSPPIAGKVWVGRDSWHNMYLAETNSIHVQWSGFHDPQSGVHHYEWCIGTSANQCDIVPLQNAHHSSSSHKGGLSLPVNTSLVATVKVINNAGLSVEGNSNIFLIDNTPPNSVVDPNFVTDGVSLRPSTQYDPSLLRLSWLFQDNESPIINHVVTITTLHEGSRIINHKVLNNKNSVTLLLKDTPLSDGDTYYASVSACNAAGLCTTTRSNGLLVDSSAPHQGGFLDELSWTYDGRTTNFSFIWDGFSDPHSLVDEYFLTVGTKPYAIDVSTDFVRVKHQLNVNVQAETFQMEVNPLNRAKFFMTIQAKNGVGLQSRIGQISAWSVKSTATAGFFDIERHSCDVSFCNLDCTCGVVGKRCTHEDPAPCKNTTGRDLPFIVMINDGSTSGKDEEYTASSKCLAMTWKDTTQNSSVPVVRYEWSFGLLGFKPGAGVFDVQNERVWNDAGLGTSAVHCLRQGVTLSHDHVYIGYVRAWWSYTEYAVFSSNGIMTDHTPPSLPTLGGATVLDLETETGVSDIDFRTQTTGLFASWKNVFNDGQSGISQYEVFVGTSFESDEVVQTTNVGLATSFNIPDIVLEPGRTYFTTVRATNHVGLSVNKTSDGFRVDALPPSPGVVYVGSVQFHARKWPHANKLSAVWLGFDDLHSFISKYEWGIGHTPDSPNVKGYADVGILTHITDSPVTLQHNEVYYVIVRATDAAGFTTVVSSPSFLVDTSAPEVISCSSFSQNQLSLPADINFNSGSMKQIQLETDAPCDSGGVLKIGNVPVQIKFLPKEDVCTFSFAFYTNGQQHLSYANSSAKALSKSLINTCLSLIYLNESSHQNSVKIYQLGKSEVAVYWTIQELESTIEHYIIGLGSTAGGYQIAPPTNTGTKWYHHFKNANLVHGMEVYATLLAVNKAGLVTSVWSAPLTIDWTSPNVKSIKLSLETVMDNGVQKAIVKGSWEAEDTESSIIHCRWTLGHSIESQDILGWRHAPDVLHSQTPLLVLKHGDEVYWTVQCTNKAGLIATKTSMPFKIVLKPPSSENAFINLDTATGLVYKSLNMFHSTQFPLQVEFGGFVDVTGIDRYLLYIGSDEKDVLNWVNVGRMTNIIFDSLNLNYSKNYTVKVKAVNSGLHESSYIETSFLTGTGVLSLTGTRATLQTVDGKKVLSWEGVFSSEDIPWYEVSIGKWQSSSEILKLKQTKQQSLIVSNIRKNTEYFLVITAVLPSGTSATYKDTVQLV